jgi:protein-L-isoaspartate(D-aspartate) O-methyltransferase
MKIGGKMVVPVGEGESQLMQRVTKVSENEISIEEFGTFRLVPLLQNTTK